MKRFCMLSSRMLALAFVLGLLSSVVSAQTVNVTMRMNTSTCLDTLRSNHLVLVEGASAKGTTPAMTWDNKSGVVCTNVGGDYWEAKFQAQAGDSIVFKFVTYFDLNHPTFHWSGWEGPIDAGKPSGNNRLLIVGTKDTTLPLQYFNGWESTLAQYWRPFAAKTDSIAVYFRVNMGGTVFDPATQIPLVRGGAPMGADPTWVTIAQLTRETNSINTGSFWSGVAYIAKAGLAANTQQLFKFVINSPETWESTPNRSFRFSSNVLNVAGDTTISWNYFNNQPPHGPAINATVNFRLRLDALEKAGLFNRGLGDKVAVTGAKGWPPTGFLFNTEPTMLKMTFVPAIKEWVLSEPFSLFDQSQIIYKYYIAFDSSRVDTANKNYTPGLRLTDGWEEPGVVGGGNRSYTYGAATDQTVAGDFGAQQQFFNSLHPNSVISTPITLKFAIDMSPAASATTNPTNALFRPGVDTVYVQFDGCLIPITQGKSMYGTDNRLMLRDSTGSGVYKGSIDLKAPTFFQVCYRMVYTSPGGEVWNGGGTNPGRRYYQYIVPTNIVGGVTWPSTFALAQMTWKPGADLTIENPPDLGPVTGVEQSGQEKPLTFALYQNYPNPFNPSTVISYSVPKNVHVTVDVFDILGQKIAALVDEQQNPGTHSVAWNARNAHGATVGSGVYFVRMQAGDFSHVNKMLLMK